MDLNELVGKKEKVNITKMTTSSKYFVGVNKEKTHEVFIENTGDYEPEELLKTTQDCLIIDVKENHLIGFVMTERKFINDMIKISNILKQSGEYAVVKDIYLMERLKIKSKVMGLYMVDEEEMGIYYLGTTEIGKYYKKLMDNNIVFKSKKIEDELGKQIRDVLRSIDLTKKEISLIEEEKKRRKELVDALGVSERDILGMVTLDLDQKIEIREEINKKIMEKIENQIQRTSEQQTLNNFSKSKEYSNIGDINIKQELELNDRVTDLRTLGQLLQRNGKLPQLEGKKFTKMGVIESCHRDDIRDVSGEFAKENSTRFSFVVIANDGTVVPLDLTQDYQEGRNPGEQNYQIDRNGEVKQDDISSRFQIGKGTFSVKKGQYGEIEVYHSAGKTIGGDGIEGNKSLDRQLETDNVWYMKKEQRDLAAEYSTNWRTIEEGYEEAKQHTDKTGKIIEGDKLNAKDIDGKKYTKSHSHKREDREER